MQSRGRFVQTETNLMGEDLLIDYKQQAIVNILLEYLAEFSFSLSLLILLQAGEWILDEIDDVVANVDGTVHI